ncbi:MAG: hypothetical protein ACXVR1_18885, partial [Solirubrobacteraceae bacterium]
GSPCSSAPDPRRALPLPLPLFSVWARLTRQSTHRVRGSGVSRIASHADISEHALQGGAPCAL